MVEEKVCPICNKPNNCMADSTEPCWCVDVTIPQALLDLVPEDKKHKSCICLKCIQSFRALGFRRQRKSSAIKK